MQTRNRPAIEAMAGGGLLFGSMGHFWYKFLDTKFPGRSKIVIVKKLACEVAAGPPFLFVVFAFVGTLEGKTWAENVNAFKQNLLFCCLVSQDHVCHPNALTCGLLFQADWGE